MVFSVSTHGLRARPRSPMVGPTGGGGSAPSSTAPSNRSEPRPETRRERRSRELRDHIYRTAQALFLEHGFDGTTVSQIADAADIAQATFFNHFQTKAAILAEMTNEVFVYIEKLVDEELSRPGPPPERILAFVRRVAQEILNVRGLAKDVLFELHQMGVKRGDMAPHVVGLFIPFEQMYREGQEQGSVRDDLDAAFLSEFSVGSLNSVVINWLGQDDYPLLERLEQTATVIAEVIGPRSREALTKSEA